MKSKILSLSFLLGLLLLFTQCEKDTLDPLEDDLTGVKKTIVVASGDESGDESGDPSNDESGDESTDPSGDDAGDDAGDESNDDYGDESDDESNDESNDDSDNDFEDESGDESDNDFEDESGDESDNDFEDESGDESADEPDAISIVVQDLWAGAGKNDTSKGKKAGTVSAEIIAPGILMIKYEMESPWALSEAHVWIGNSLSEVPKNAAPGEFTFQKKMDLSYSAEFEVNLTLLGIDYINDNIYIAAHGVAGNENETVWAFGDHTFISLGVANKWGWVFML